MRPATPETPPDDAVIHRSTIRVKNLRLRTFVGLNEEEQQKRQDVVINLVIAYDAMRAAT